MCAQNRREKAAVGLSRLNKGEGGKVNCLLSLKFS